MRPPKAPLGFFDRRFALRGLREIAGDHNRLAACGFHLRSDWRNRRGIATKERQLATLGGESMGDRGAHPLGGTRDHHDAVFKR
ncbi:hypothetical protein V1282_005879 [Nitrobacteraceae bacterium AZCC 2146]